MKKSYKKSRLLASQVPASYCPAAFREIYSASDGNYKLCCHANKSPELKRLNENKVLPFEYFMSKEMDKIRSDMMEGNDIPECAKCHGLEKSGNISPRYNWLDKCGLISTVDKVDLKLRISGSFCNLGCYMCGPTNSSTRRKVFDEIYDKNDDMRSHFYFDSFTFKHTHWNNVVANILENIHLVNKIHMTGGEPLQLPKYWEFLDSIPKDIAKNIKLSHDTNLTKIRYKNHSIHSTIDKFKEVSYSVSCDHVGDKLAWIRNPIDVKEFENNLEELCETSADKRIQVSIGILNIDDLFQIRDYYKNKFGMEVRLENMVVRPELLSIRNLPKELKNLYIDRYNEHPFIVAELKKDSSGLYDKALKYCDDLSSNMENDFRVIWKDWLEYVDSFRLQN